MSIKRIAVYCGSGKGTKPAYEKAAREFGKAMSRHGIGLVFGGGHVGIMGVVADAVLEEGGEAIGVIPGFLKKREVGHTGLTEMIEVESMHIRKQKMVDLADAFAILPGGLGTLDELMEILTWKQLGLNQSPIGILNTEGYYTPLMGLMHHMESHGFIRNPIEKYIKVSDEPERLLELLVN
ncbi:MAG: TIGR00730 family Rossman fold protein [Bacteroidota bacterium]